MDNKQIRNRYLALFLAFVMLIGILPTNIFAEPAQSPKKAGGAIESSVSDDANNAIHAYVGIQVGGDLNLPLSGGAQNQQFIPIQGVRAYFQWFENGGYASPVYTAVSDAQGRLNIGCKPYLASDGKIIKFDADTTVSGGNEKYRFWIDDKNLPASLKDHQLQYITGENVVFPSDNSWVSQGGATTSVVKNTLSDMKILFMEKPKAFMHKAQATETPAIREGIGSGGTVFGKVTWDYESPSGGVNWGIVATPSSKAPGVQIKASYLSDYALKQIYSDATVSRMSLSSPDDIRGSKWSYALEAQLQKWIQEQVEKDPNNWIAETVTTKAPGTNAEGDYKIQFNGTWGPARNGDVYDYKIPPRWPQALKDRVGKVADKATDGSFALAALPKDAKHINNDWMFISAVDTEGIRVMTPYNNNWFTGISGLTGNWGYHNGWAQTAFGNTTALAANNVRADFGFGSPGINFDITNYDSDANTALPGDVAQTKTTGLPYKYATDKFVIVWYGPDGNEVPDSRGTAQQPSSTGTIPSTPLDTSKLTINKTTEYTAKLYRVKPDGSLGDQPIAADSFTVEVSHLFISRYDNVSLDTTKAGDKEMDGAKYYATGLPQDLTMTEADGTIKGKAKEADLYKVDFKTVLTDPSGNIEGTRARYLAVTDSPLKAGEVGVAYSQDVKPEPATDPNGRAYIYKMKSVNFISGKEIAGLKVEGDADTGFKITGTPTAKVEATEDVLNGDPGPNVEVTYDIYKTNDAGKEILVAPDHKDLVPLAIKSGQSAQYDPKYTAVDGKVGTPATVAAPKFLDQKSATEPKPEANPKPTGMTFALGDGAPTVAKVDKDTGVVTYTPTLADAGKTVEIPVVVTYLDGTTDETTAPIKVAEADNTKYTPKYKAVTAQVGHEVTVAPPTFLDKDGKTATPAVTKYELGEGAKAGVTINGTTGEIKYTAVDADKNTVITVPVKVTYADGSIGETTAEIDVPSDADFYDPKAKPEVVEKGTKPNLTDKNITTDKTFPKNTKIVDKSNYTTSGENPVDYNTPGSYTGVVEVQYPDGTKDIVSVPITVKDTTAPAAPKVNAKDDGSVEITPPADLDTKSVDVTYTPEGKTEPKTVTVMKGDDGKWKSDDPDVKVDPDSGKIIIPADKVKDGTDVTAKAKNESGNESGPATGKTPDNTKDEVVPYLPDETEPTKGSDGKTIPSDYITVTFKSEDATKGKVKVGAKEGVEVKAKVKPNTNLAGKAEAVAENGYGFTKWDPELGVAQADNPYVAKFIKSGDEVKANDPIPTGWHRVTVKQDATSIADGTVTEKYYAVAPNEKLTTAGAFPDLTGKAATDYENPAWYADGTKVDNPADKAITAETTFIAKADPKTASDNTKDEVVPYLPDEKEPTVGNDGKTIPKDYITVTFKSEEAAKGKVKVGTKEGVEVKAKVKPNTNLAGKAEAVAENGYGFTKWDPELGVAQATKPYVAKFIKDGSEVGKDDPLPTGWHRVTVKQDATSIADGTVTEKYYAVAPKDEAKGQTGTLAADKFPSLENKAAEGYENPAWYKDAETTATADPSTVAITADTTFTAKADPKTAATKTADKLTPEYGDKTGTAGTAVTTDAPTFKDTDGKATTAPEGTKYKLGDGAPEGATIDENTGKVTYTPKELEAGKPVEIPVVVTYPDQSTDNAKAKINVEALPDVIDRTNNPNATTPDGYVRVTFTNGEGVNEIENNKVYDVKSGTALTADKYPTVTAKGGYENPVWSTPAGTAITAANATITATASATSGSDTTAPAAPTVTANNDGSVDITPPTDADTKTVTVTYKDNDGNDKTVTATKGDDGNWTVPEGSEAKVDKTSGVITIPADKVKDGTDVTAKAKDATGNVSDPATDKAKTSSGGTDTTAPKAPTVTANNDGSVDITPPTDADTKTVDITYTPEGKTDPVTVTATKGDDGKWTVPADSGLKVDENGKITIPADKVKDGTDVTAKAKDETGNVSDPATGKTPGSGETAKPTIINGKAENDPSKTTTTVSGKTKPNTEVVIKDKDRNELGKATSDENGDFTTEVPKQEKGTKVTLTPKDGTPSEVTVTEKGGTITPPPLPIPDNYLRWPIYFAPTKTEVKPAPVLERHESYINGYPDGTVRPDGKITRAEVSAIFARLTQKNTLAQFVAQYSDVKINDWFTDSIMKLSSKGILTGYPDGTFKPNRSITRAEFANIVSKYIKNPKSANETFTDVPMNHWAKNAIAMVKAEGWITGYPDGTFRPDAPITRAEAVSIVNRMFDRAADTNFVSVHDYEIKSYTDLNGGHWAYYEIMEATQTHNYEKLGVRVERWDNLVK